MTSLLLQLCHRPGPSCTSLSMLEAQAPLAPALPNAGRLFSQPCVAPLMLLQLPLQLKCMVLLLAVTFPQPLLVHPPQH